MRAFTFVSITYNHADFILSHLDSIAALVQKYGRGRDISLIVADDCSDDQTMKIVRKWIRINGELFFDIILLEGNKNIGVVRNVIRALKEVRTNAFKMLAGDDYYLDNDIFSLAEEGDDTLIITRCQRFGEGASEEKKRKYDKKFQFAKWLDRQGVLRVAQNVIHTFDTPGALFPHSFLDDDIYNLMEQFHWIEDIPMWWYFICKEKYFVRVVDDMYIAYRVGSGISTNREHERYNDFDREREAIRKRFLKKWRYPKYVNPWRYWMKWQKLRFSIYQWRKAQL